ncbi:hypothetical protein CGLO_16331 [Colletotrichum gloeosporioides Cg-14]|uniref:Uncharacterized protein n=1 Tax=Colletotrichum gloeosporioides (strain Cg-14) TaxID=1237896 RepID=T0JZ69_COLGC|nr:hypothetical protein CGLO_16331 [Colletotrichum gloeosporioides Cg-14]
MSTSRSFKAWAKPLFLIIIQPLYFFNFVI